MNAIWTEPALSILLFLGAGGAVLGLVRVLRPAMGSCRWATVALLGLATVAGGFGGAALAAGRPVGVWLPAVALLGLCALSLLSSCGVFSPLATWTSRAVRSPGLRAATLLTGCPALAIWWALEGPAAYPPVPSFQAQQEDTSPDRQLQEVSSVSLQTDAGRPVKVSRRVSPPEPPAALAARQAEMVSRWGLNSRVIALPATTEDCNCHGWVFTGGAHWLHSKELAAILADNGYRKVSKPKPGDVVLYRSELGDIVHSGLVHSVCRDGLVLVESKWGELGRFIHPAEEHPYTDCVCSYLRTARGDHLLQGIARPTTVAAATLPAAQGAESPGEAEPALGGE